MRASHQERSLQRRRFLRNILLKTGLLEHVGSNSFILTRVNVESELGFMVLVYIRQILKAHILFNLLTEYSSEIVVRQELSEVGG